MPTPRKGTIQPARRGAPSDYATSIGERIRRRRVELHWNQETLGQKMGVGRDTISRYETGQAEIGAGELLRLAQILGVSISSLFGAPRENSVLLIDELEMFFNYRLLNDSEKQKAYSYIEGLALQRQASKQPLKESNEKENKSSE